MTMKITGGCHCGAIRYEAEVDPETVAICHCTDCQTQSGTAYRVVVRVHPGSLKLLSGEPKVYLKTAESGRQRTQTFCANCGTPIYSADPTNTKQHSIRVGTIRERAQLVPKRQIWCRSALSWVWGVGPLERIETQDF
jgi:hypothetical protein